MCIQQVHFTSTNQICIRYRVQWCSVRRQDIYRIQVGQFDPEWVSYKLSFLCFFFQIVQYTYSVHKYKN